MKIFETFVTIRNMQKLFTAQKPHSLYYFLLAYAITTCLFVLICHDAARAVRVSEEEVVGKPVSQPPPPSAAPRPTVSPAPPKTPPPPERTTRPPVTTTQTSQKQSKPVRLPTSRTTPKTEMSAPRGQTPPEAKKEEKKEERSVTIDFDNVDILLFVKFISEVTGKNFIIDQKVKGKVTIISPTKISVDEAYRVFESVLEVHGFTTIDSDNVIKIVPSVVARGKSIETRLKEEAGAPEDKVVTQLMRLKYANPDELKKLFAPLISKSSVIVSYPPSGMLIVTDVLSNIQRLFSIIAAIDVVGVGEEISVIPLEHAEATKLTSSLTTIFQSTGRTATARKGQAAESPTIKIVADERTNSLIISASEYDTERMKVLIKILDQETPRGMGNIRVHYLQYADAEELSKVLTALPTTDSKTAAKKGAAPTISKDVKIVADKATNSLVITTSKQDYITLSEVIAKLDIPRPMVYLEALIMEVKATKNFAIGTEWYVGDDNIGSFQGRTLGAFGASTPSSDSIIPGVTGVAAGSGVTLGVLGESITIGGITFPSIAAVARAFQSDSDVHILQTPQILTTDNEEAEIQVTENRPYLTKEASGDQDYQTYEYRDVGLKLKITPQISQDRFVRLKIFQEYSTLSSGGDRPITLKRTTDTTVLVRDSESVVIGGLIGDEINRGTSGVPCLGNIPLIGWAFKSYSRSQDKTNLFIFLTPHVIQDPVEAEKIFQDKKEGMDRVEEGVIKMYERTRPPIQPIDLEEEAIKLYKETEPPIQPDETTGPFEPIQPIQQEPGSE